VKLCLKKANKQAKKKNWLFARLPIYQQNDFDLCGWIYTCVCVGGQRWHQVSPSIAFHFFFFLTKLEGVYMPAMVRGQHVGASSLLPLWSPGNQVAKLDGKHFYLLSHLTERESLTDPEPSQLARLVDPWASRSCLSQPGLEAHTGEARWVNLCVWGQPDLYS
jgi:hypothetical protein